MGYIKLRGGETPTPENERRAKSFMRWFSLRFEALRKEWLYNGKFNDEVATDTAIYIYDSIALKGLVIKGKYKYYFLRAYHMRILAESKKRVAAAKKFISLDAPSDYSETPLKDMIAAPDFDYVEFEQLVDSLNSEMLEYVRERYPPLDASLFEIYIALQPGISYKRMGKMLGYSPNKIWPAIGAIKKDLAVRFAEKGAIIRSIS